MKYVLSITITWSPLLKFREFGRFAFEEYIGLEAGPRNPEPRLSLHSTPTKPHMAAQGQMKDSGIGLFCPLCNKQQQRPNLHAAFFAHLRQQHSDEITELQQKNPTFNVKIWGERLKAISER